MSDITHRPATIAAQAAGAVDTAGAGVVPGIQPATTFLRGPDNALLKGGKTYGRDDNDTVRQAEEVLRQLEGAAATLLFPSGMAAVAALLRTVPNGGRIILQSGIYWGVTKWAQDFCTRRDIRLDQVDACDLIALRAACDLPADLVWIEVPSNPWLKITDISGAADLAHQAGAILAVDGTAAPPTMTQALRFGADVVMHSATKAINGHTDVLAGVLSCADAQSPQWQAIATDRHDAGAIIGPFGAWLLMRGMRTLPLRLERMSENAQAIAEYLTAHDQVEAVWYPGLPDHPGHELAKRQMQGGFGYMLSVVIKGGETAALATIGRLKLFHRATSLGGVESLVEHRHSIEPHSGIPPGLLRLSVGIEHVDDLIADIAKALRD